MEAPTRGGVPVGVLSSLLLESHLNASGSQSPIDTHDGALQRMAAVSHQDEAMTEPPELYAVEEVNENVQLSSLPSSSGAEEARKQPGFGITVIRVQILV